MTKYCDSSIYHYNMFVKECFQLLPVADTRESSERGGKRRAALAFRKFQIVSHRLRLYSLHWWYSAEVDKLLLFVASQSWNLPMTPCCSNLFMPNESQNSVYIHYLALLSYVFSIHRVSKKRLNDALLCKVFFVLNICILNPDVILSWFWSSCCIICEALWSSG